MLSAAWRLGLNTSLVVASFGELKIVCYLKV